MPAPSLTAQQVQDSISGVADVQALDAGGHAAIFSCTIDGRSYALKVLRDPAADPQASRSAVERAMREISILRECSTPHLVRAGPRGLEPFQVAGERYLCFTEELVDGENLRRTLNTVGPLDASEVARLGLEVGLAVASIWDRRTVHRDLKPENIMRRRADGSFVLLDCGIAFDLDASSLTPTGFSSPATPIYLSPEQAQHGRKRDLDFRSDLFSLGIVMYEVLTGFHPFRLGATSVLAVVNNIVAVHPPPPSQLRPTATSALDSVIMRLLAKRPHMRFRSCEDFLQMVKGIGLV